MEKVLINGEFINSDEGINIINPNNNEIAGVVPALKKPAIDYAFKSARKAFTVWQDVSLLRRIEYLEKVALLLEKYRSQIATTIMNEVAKGYNSAIGEINRTIQYIRYTNEEAKRIHPEAQTGEGEGAQNKRAIFTRVPLGVVLAISPFNYPINLAFSKIAPALVMGNTVVFKSATQGSLTGCWISKVIAEAGIPKGVFNQISGRGRDIGDLLSSHKEINMISFTGGEKVGKRLARNAEMVPLVLELGGKDAAIVCEDADFNLVAKEIIKGGLSYSGQRCTAIKRVFLTQDSADQLIPLLKTHAEKLSVGSPEDNSFITPLISNASADFIQGLIDDAKAKGAKIITGDKRVKNLFYPTIITDVKENMRLAWEEPFGPVIPLIIVKTIEEAIELNNRSEFGLQGSIFTNNINKAMSISEKMNTGTVNINRSSSRGPDSFPFIGIKSSGLGVQGIRKSLISMSRIKGLIINW